MTENQILEKIGIVKFMSSKNGYNSFCLTDWKNDQGKDIWISSKKELGFNKDDEIKFSYTTTVNGVYTNYYVSKSEVVNKGTAEVVTPPQSSQTPNTPNVTNVTNPEVNPRNTGKALTKVEFIKDDTGEGLGKRLSVFGETNNVFATQTHPTNIGWGAFVWHKVFQ